jgi:hypothetical protein
MPTLASLLVESARDSRSKTLFRTMSTSWALFTLVTMSVWFPIGGKVGRLGLHPLAALILFTGLVYRCIVRLRRDAAAQQPAGSRPQLVAA